MNSIIAICFFALSTIMVLSKTELDGFDYFWLGFNFVGILFSIAQLSG